MVNNYDSWTLTLTWAKILIAIAKNNWCDGSNTWMTKYKKILYREDTWKVFKDYKDYMLNR